MNTTHDSRVEHAHWRYSHKRTQNLDENEVRGCLASFFFTRLSFVQCYHRRPLCLHFFLVFGLLRDKCPTLLLHRIRKSKSVQLVGWSTSRVAVFCRSGCLFRAAFKPVCSIIFRSCRFLSNIFSLLDTRFDTILNYSSLSIYVRPRLS